MCFYRVIFCKITVRPSISNFVFFLNKLFKKKKKKERHPILFIIYTNLLTDTLFVSTSKGMTVQKQNEVDKVSISLAGYAAKLKRL